MKVLVNVSESEFTKVYKGMKVDVYLDVYGEERFEGVVELIHPTIDRRRARLPLKSTSLTVMSAFVRECLPAWS